MSEDSKLFCAIDVETTGRNHRIHEMIQICILPLNSRFEPHLEEVFYHQIKAENPETAITEALEINGLNPTLGLNKEKSLESFYSWIKCLFQNNEVHKIIPIGQNYSFDEEFVKDWLGFDEYEKFFDYNVRDTKSNAALFHDSILPGFKSGLADQAKYFEIGNDKHHDALNDCMVTAATYKAHVEYMKSLKEA